MHQYRNNSLSSESVGQWWAHLPITPVQMVWFGKSLRNCSDEGNIFIWVKISNFNGFVLSIYAIFILNQMNWYLGLVSLVSRLSVLCLAPLMGGQFKGVIWEYKKDLSSSTHPTEMKCWYFTILFHLHTLLHARAHWKCNETKREVFV